MVSAADGGPAYEISLVNQTEQTSNNALIIRVESNRFQLGDRGPLTFFKEFFRRSPESAKSCFNPMLWQAGTEYTITSTESEGGEFIGEFSSNLFVQGAGSFNGRPATVLYVEDPDGTPDANEYYQIDFTTPSVNAIADENLQGSDDSYVSDPGDLLRFDLEPGDSFTATTTYTDGSANSSTGPYTVTYIGRETVTVPAGTFETCHFQLIAAENTGTYINDEWLGVGNGLEILETDSDGGSSPVNREELVSASINGTPVR